MNHKGRGSNISAGEPAVQAITTDGRVVSVSASDTVLLGRNSTTQRVLLDSDLARSAQAALAFRGLLLVAIAVAVIAIWA